MESLLWATLGFIFAIALLVTFHEYGHFWMARRLGIKVLKFSIGFGRPIWKRVSKNGIEYAIGWLPLGGYVKLLDGREEEITETDKAFALNNQPIWARMLVVLAGPFFNFIFAIFAYWLVFIIGITTIAPIIGTVAPGSIANKAGLSRGDQIVSIDNQKVLNWQQVNLALLPHLGQDKFLNVDFLENKSNQLRKAQLNLQSWQINHKRPNFIEGLGITPYFPDTPAVIGRVQANSPASVAGLKVGDKIIRVNGIAVQYWQQLLPLIARNANKPMQMLIIRDGVQKQILVTPEIMSHNGKRKPILGIAAVPVKWPPELLRTIRYPVGQALIKSFVKTGETIQLTFTILYKIVVGQISVKTLSGPIGIAQGAGYSAQQGLNYFISFLAIISISLGVLNLLPVPMLDGGHFLYYFIEAIRGKPLSDKMQILGFKIGLFLIILLMFVAITNDLLRIF